MGERVEPTGAAGCLVALAGAGVALAVWLRGAGRGVRGGFEDERDLSLLYVDLPLMVLAFPAVALAVWALARGALRGRGGRGARTAVPFAGVAVTLSILAWAGLAWLDTRVAPFVHAGW